MNVRSWLMVGLLAVALVGTGCSRVDPSIVAQAEGEADAAEGDAIGVSAAEAGIAYEDTQLEAPANTEFVVSFVNPAATPHNWVLVEPGQEEAVVEAAQQQGEQAQGLEGVIAATPVIASADETVSVPALEPGEYTYVCTVTGHYAAGMHGTLIVGEPGS